MKQFIQDGYLYTQYENGEIVGEPITNIEAAEWQAENKF